MIYVYSSCLQVVEVRRLYFSLSAHISISPSGGLKAIHQAGTSLIVSALWQRQNIINKLLARLPSLGQLTSYQAYQNPLRCLS
jgi:hypothetical protein